MEKDNAFEVLVKNLSKKGLECETHLGNTKYIIPARERLMSTKYVIAPLGPCFFCAYDSFVSGSASSSTGSGIYATVYLPEEAECHIYPKSWADRIFRVNKRKTGVGYLDDNLTVTSSSGWTPVNLVSHKDVGLFLKINEKINPLKIIFQHDYFPGIASLKNKTIVGVETNLWLYENKDLDLMISLAGKLVENIKNSCPA